MDKWKSYLLFAAVIPLLFSGCSDKNSGEACIHEVSQNLDKGNFDAVLSSSCANAMQKGAAYFGKAGFDIKDIIVNFSKTGVISNVTSSTTSTAPSDLNVYLTALVTNVTDSSLSYLDNAVLSYETYSNDLTVTSDSRKDAQFYISLVDSVKALSLLRLALPTGINLDGTLNVSCDENSNGVPDDADATSCALLVSASQPCSSGSTTIGVVSQNITPLVFSGVTGTFRGLVITVPGNGTNTSCPNPSEFRKLLFLQGSTWVVATTTTETCAGTSLGTSAGDWPCPLVENGVPVDLVQALSTSMTSAVDSLSSSLTGTSQTDVQTAIQDIQAQACCGCTSTPCAACTGCTSQNVASYLQTLK